MSKTTHDYEAIGKAVVLLASLFSGSTAVPQAAAASPRATTGGAEASTPDAPKADAAGNSQGLTPEQFGKRMMEFAAACKEIWAGYTSNDPANPKIERGAMVKTEDYDAVLAQIDEHLEAIKLG